MGLIMRRNLMAAKSGYTAKDYVQDGLIAMWDGIENAGFAADGIEHDPNATVWKDLIGSNDWTIVGGVWTNNALTNPDKKCSAINNGFVGIEKPLSVEYVFKIGTNQSGNGVLLHVIDWHSNLSMERCLVNSSGGISIESNSEKQISNSEFMSNSSLSVIYNNTDANARVNGIEVAIRRGSSENWYWNDAPVNCIGNRPDNTRGNDCEFCSIRYYSKALSDAERAANYAIDKARFGLT